MTMKDKSGRDLTNVKKWMDMKPYDISKKSDYAEWLITPAIADSLLSSMVRNRKISWVAVEQYANEMRRGSWRKETSCISLDPEGHLIDGQHRLLAIKEIDTPIVMRVQLNVPPDTPFDNGRKRTDADNAYMTGAVSKELATGAIFAIASRVLTIIYGTKRARSFTQSEKMHFVQVFGDEMALAIDISLHGQSAPLGRNASVQCAIFAALHCGVQKDILRRFAEVMNTGLAKSQKEWGAVKLHGLLEDSKGACTHASKLQKESWTEQAIRDFLDEYPRQKKYHTLQFPFLDMIADEVKEVMA